MPPLVLANRSTKAKIYASKWAQIHDCWSTMLENVFAFRNAFSFRFMAKKIIQHVRRTCWINGDEKVTQNHYDKVQSC